MGMMWLVTRFGIPLLMLWLSLTPLAFALSKTLPATGSLAFVSDLDGDMEIFLLDIDRSFLYQVTDNLFADRFPSWAPDGRQIAFQSNRDGNYEIYTMNANGSHVRRLTETDADDTLPAWSPDGAQIAFVSQRNGGGEIYVMDADGSRVRQLTDNFAWDGNPTWLPDGRIGFDSTRNLGSDVLVMDIDGDHVQQITTSNGGSVQADWSADGCCIIWVASRENGITDLYTLQASCSTCPPEPLTDSAATELTPTWSPDGQWIAYTSIESVSLDLFIVRSDGSVTHQLTDGPASDLHPVWWP
jgi:TolB protein